MLESVGLLSGVFSKLVKPNVLAVTGLHTLYCLPETNPELELHQRATHT